MYFVLYLLVTNTIFKYGMAQEVEKCFQDKFCIPANYNRFDRPSEGKLTSMKISEFMYITVFWQVQLK